MSIRGQVFPGPALSKLDPALESSTLGCSYKLTCSAAKQQTTHSLTRP